MAVLAGRDSRLSPSLPSLLASSRRIGANGESRKSIWSVSLLFRGKIITPNKTSLQSGERNS